MRDAGFEVAVNRQVVTAETLRGASGLIVAGPMVPLRREEYVAITDFVKAGGTLLMTIHVPYPVLAVPAHWGLPVSPAVMMSENPVAGANDASIFVADVVRPGPLTEGVSRIAVVSGWPVSATSRDATIAVATGADTIADKNRNQKLDPGEKGSFGVVGMAKVGRGTVVVLGDDAIFANIALYAEDNVKLLDNVIRLMRAALEA
jgi:hypothetical protein